MGFLGEMPVKDKEEGVGIGRKRLRLGCRSDTYKRDREGERTGEEDQDCGVSLRKAQAGCKLPVRRYVLNLCPPGMKFH